MISVISDFEASAKSFTYNYRKNKRLYEGGDLSFGLRGGVMKSKCRRFAVCYRMHVIFCTLEVEHDSFPKNQFLLKSVHGARRSRSSKLAMPKFSLIFLSKTVVVIGRFTKENQRKLRDRQL